MAINLLIELIRASFVEFRSKRKLKLNNPDHTSEAIHITISIAQTSQN